MFKKFCAYLHLIPPIKSSAVVNLHFVFVLLLCHQFKPQKSFVCGRHLKSFSWSPGEANLHDQSNMTKIRVRTLPKIVQNANLIN